MKIKGPGDLPPDMGPGSASDAKGSKGEFQVGETTSQKTQAKGSMKEILSQVQDRLNKGDITTYEEAVDAVVDEVIQRRFSQVLEDKTNQEEARQEVSQVILDDPVFSLRLRSLFNIES